MVNKGLSQPWSQTQVLSTLYGEEETKGQLTKHDPMLAAQILSTHTCTPRAALHTSTFFVRLTPDHSCVRWALLLPPCHRLGQRGTGYTVTCPRLLSGEGVEAGLGSRPVWIWLKEKAEYNLVKCLWRSKLAEGNSLWKNTRSAVGTEGGLKAF